MPEVASVPEAATVPEVASVPDAAPVPEAASLPEAASPPLAVTSVPVAGVSALTVFVPRTPTNAIPINTDAIPLLSFRIEKRCLFFQNSIRSSKYPIC